MCVCVCGCVWVCVCMYIYTGMCAVDPEREVRAKAQILKKYALLTYYSKYTSALASENLCQDVLFG